MCGEITMKYSVVLTLILILFISIIFAQKYKSSIEENQKKYKWSEDFHPIAGHYLPGTERKYLPAHPQKDCIFNGIHQDELFDRDWDFFPQQNYSDKDFLPNSIDRMGYPLGRRYGNIQVTSEEQNNRLTDSIDEAWISRYGSGLVPASDLATDIVADSLGNVYVTGYSTNSPYGMDYFTAKYNTSGVMQWSVRYDGGLDDLAIDIEIDRHGNLYVTGYSWDSGTDYDYATVKYNTAGVEQWAVRYNGSGNGYDRPYSLAVDGEGNVYVTGYSSDSQNFGDYATVKYNAAGEEQWIARYNGPGKSSDGANAVAVDVKGNVYVTGCVFGSGTEYDYGTVKYNSSGEELWSVFYNGPANMRDYATSIAVNLEGNIFITGNSFNSIIDCDYTTVKYNTAGEEQWVMRYNGPGNLYDYANALTIDKDNNVYITGSSFGLQTDYDCATVKYNTRGEMQWAARYNGPGNDYDFAYSLVVDFEGSVYITGCTSYSPGENEDFATVKYNADGVEQWSALYNGPGNSNDYANALAIDQQGNVYVTGSSYSSETKNDYATLKYNEMGVEQWAVRYNGPGNSYGLAFALALDVEGNVYVTGNSRSSGPFGDIATVKYNAVGEEQWAVRYNGPGNHSDNATALVVDNDANVFVTGSTLDTTTAYNYGTIKYNSEGVEQWSAIYNGPGNGNDDAYSLVVDGHGNVYVTGRSYGSGTDYDYATVKYNSAGVQQWVSRYNGLGNGSDGANSLGIDGESNVYVTGRSYNDYVTVKYNSAGVQQWVAHYNGPGNGIDNGEALAVDGLGNVYVTGSSQDSETSFDFATIKYNAAGVQQWVVRYNGSGNSHDGARALAVDVQGNLYVTGASRNLGTATDYTTIKYDTAGVEQWSAHYNGPANGPEYANAIEVDQQGNVYVTGQSFGSWEIGRDYATVKYNSAGEEQWVMRYNGSGNSTDNATALAVDGAGNVYITGYSSIVGGLTYTTIKYAQTATGLMQEVFNPPLTYKLEQNYPNPFNPSTNIEFLISKTEFVTLKIYNLQGQKIATLVSERLTLGNYNYTWDASGFASGVYYYQIQTREFQQVKKLILMK